MHRWTNYLGFLLAAMLLTGCGARKVVSAGKVDSRMTVRNVIRNHMSGTPDFKTLSGRLAIDYSDGENDQSVTVSLRMKRDEVIWLSAPLGVVKVYITPGRVSYYNKLQNEYFDGDFAFIRGLLGSDIDFQNLQNLLLGQAVRDLRDEKYNLSVTDEAYELKPEVSRWLYKLFYEIEPQNFRLASQQISQPELKRLMEVRYQTYQEVEGRIFPEELHIAAIEQDERITIGITYRQVEINRDLSYPYKIPKGFNQITAQ
ncbi:DUF4292 domain-containing protein [Robiginitalea sp. SC105]|uniref:DUF4292 domain-containing protein n=1 Tax=Robiginitalea sp. SC105 TaxID=2762332 RepID=UPI00163AFCF6|nr:DUF4292 domain-containing protein [Robiginitalea sp. SC105]MBC2838271.1 DUF4292 domain-containing protein [Robiginitalea sp. SC105]